MLSVMNYILIYYSCIARATLIEVRVGPVPWGPH